MGKAETEYNEHCLLEKPRCPSPSTSSCLLASSDSSDNRLSINTGKAETEYKEHCLLEKPRCPSPRTSSCLLASTDSSVSPSSSSLHYKTPSNIPPTSSDKTDNHDTFDTTTINCPEHVHVPEDTTRDMRNEEERLKSFENWPVTFLSPRILAKNGFYYLGRGDEVRCAFCKVEIMKWVEGDDPALDHQRWAPQCPLVQQRSADEPVGKDECGVRNLTTSAIRMPGPVHKKYASLAARLRTFKDWPRSLRQKPDDLAEAGFFYTGQGDKTKCFYCDGGLKDWEEDDIPWEQHARWFSRCAYVQLVKGKQFVQMVISESCYIENDDKSETAPSQAAKPQEPIKEENTIEDTKLCKICYSEERNICFVPCGHVVACAKCALANTNCPMCRRTIDCVQRLYYP